MVPALMEQKITVVIFPLLGLLLDQVNRMQSKGLDVCYLMSDMDDSDIESIIHELYAKPPAYKLNLIYFRNCPLKILTIFL